MPYLHASQLAGAPPCSPPDSAEDVTATVDCCQPPGRGRGILEGLKLANKCPGIELTHFRFPLPTTHWPEFYVKILNHKWGGKCHTIGQQRMESTWQAAFKPAVSVCHSTWHLHRSIIPTSYVLLPNCEQIMRKHCCFGIRDLA